MPENPQIAVTGARPPTLVVADDEAHIRLVVSEKFRAAGFVVHEARDGEEALDLVRQHRPDAIITDLQMPYMSGLELTTKVACDPELRSIPAVLLTARGHILDQDDLSRTVIRRIMSKPFGVRELVQYVQELGPVRAAQARVAGALGGGVGGVGRSEAA